MLIVIAGFLFLIDKLFNTSNNWLRNITTELRIRNEIYKLHQDVMIRLYNPKLFRIQSLRFHPSDSCYAEVMQLN